MSHYHLLKISKISRAALTRIATPASYEKLDIIIIYLAEQFEAYRNTLSFSGLFVFDFSVNR